MLAVIRHTRALALSFIAALALAAGAQQPAQKPIVILFVGNSFFHGQYQPVKSYNVAAITDENAGVARGDPRSEGTAGPYGGIPAIFKKLTDEAGLNYEVHSELISGKSLEFHYTNALPVIDQAKWNAVVMHDFSTGPVPKTHTGNPESFVKYTDLIEQTVHKANPAAKIYFYETWSRADQTFPAKAPYFGEPIETMGKDPHDAYYAEFAKNGHLAGLAPAGDAWLRAIKTGIAMADPYHPETGKINLWGADSYHPSSAGAYLNALVLVGEITGKDPRAFGGAEEAAKALGIAPEMAVTLQRIAYEQVEEGKATKRR